MAQVDHLLTRDRHRQGIVPAANGDEIDIPLLDPLLHIKAKSSVQGQGRQDAGSQQDGFSLALAGGSDYPATYYASVIARLEAMIAAKGGAA